MVLQFFGEVRAKTFIVRHALVAFGRRARRNAPTPSSNRPNNKRNEHGKSFKRTNERKWDEGRSWCVGRLAIVFNFLYIGFAKFDGLIAISAIIAGEPMVQFHNVFQISINSFGVSLDARIGCGGVRVPIANRCRYLFTTKLLKWNALARTHHIRFDVFPPPFFSNTHYTHTHTQDEAPKIQSIIIGKSFSCISSGAIRLLYVLQPREKAKKKKRISSSNSRRL